MELLLEYYDKFRLACEYFEVPPKYVLFSVVSALGATALALAVRGGGRLAWLTARGLFKAARYVLVRRPDETGRLVLRGLKGGTYSRTCGELTQISGAGVTAQWHRINWPDGPEEVVSAHVNGHNVKLCKATKKALHKLFAEEERKLRAAEDATRRALEAARLAGQKATIRRALCDAEDGVAQARFVPEERPVADHPATDPSFVGPPAPTKAAKQPLSDVYGGHIQLPIGGGRVAWFRRVVKDGEAGYIRSEPPDQLPEHCL